MLKSVKSTARQFLDDEASERSNEYSSSDFSDDDDLSHSDESALSLMDEDNGNTSDDTAVRNKKNLPKIHDGDGSKKLARNNQATKNSSSSTINIQCKDLLKGPQKIYTCNINVPKHTDIMQVVLKRRNKKDINLLCNFGADGKIVHNDEKDSAIITTNNQQGKFLISFSRN